VRYLILSDIHGNWEGLEAVLRAAAGGYDQALCCGDLIGYCADPNRVVDWVRSACSAVVRGNHDKGCSGLDDLSWFNPVARHAAVWTQEQLTAENLAYVRDLPRGPLRCDGFQLLHGSPADEDEYVVGSGEAADAFDYVESRIAFFGHTHLQGGFVWNRGRVETVCRIPMTEDERRLEIASDCGYLINPGSVGQPRDGDPRSAFLIYDSDAGFVLYRRVGYDIETAQEKIHRAGLPSILADRLSSGR
jgi:predicted phosphodiesterase